MPHRMTLAALTLCVGTACSPALRAPDFPPPMAVSGDSAATAITATDLAPSDLAGAIAVLGRYVPDVAVRYRIRWWYQTRRGTTSGRGTVTIGPPDTLRFDYRASLGRRGSMGVIDDRVIWARPDSLGAVIAGRVPLLWAALGAPRAAGSTILQKTEPSREVVRFLRADTALTYTISPRPVLQLTAAAAVSNHVLGSAVLWHDSLTHAPSTGLMRLMNPDLVLRFAIDQIDTVRTLSDTWFAAPLP